MWNRQSVTYQSVYFILLLLGLAVPGASAEPIKQPHVTAELVSEYENVVPGESATFALRLVPEDGWHVYWKYAGDFGSAPIFSWSVNGVEIHSDTQWPTPERIHTGPYTNYGYSDEVYFLADIAMPAPNSIPSDSVRVVLDAEWLVCKEECIPGFAKFDTSFPVAGNASERTAGDHAPAIQETRSRLPVRTNRIPVSLHSVSKSHITLELPLDTVAVENAYFIPAQPGLISNSAPQELEFFKGAARLSLQKAENFGQTGAEQLSGLLFKSPVWNEGQSALEISIPILTGSTESNSTGSAQSTDSSLSSVSILIALLSALLGGIILNIMPCVFPVISIKILGFVEQAGNKPALVRRHGLVFAAGVVCSFWLLAAMVLLFRSAGSSIGWGFQMQNPDFVASIYLLLFTVALNLFGVFEVGLGLQRVGGKLSGPSAGYSGSFFSGILATILATPCTAPFLGSAVAFAFAASALYVWGVFTCIAIGLAAPYVALSCFPAALNRLPRPGMWMVYFKQAMGFPVLLTALWLLWVLEKQAGSQAVLALLIASILVAFGLWALGHTSTPSTSRSWRCFGKLLTAAGFAGGIIIALPVDPATRPPGEVVGNEQDEYGQNWLPFSEESLAAAVRSGKPVYVDFTARWCVTCQVNKKFVFGSARVRSLIEARDVLLMKADWTRYNPDITKALRKHGKAGVPLNLLYIPGTAAPVVFPTVLSPGIVLEKLKRL